MMHRIKYSKSLVVESGGILMIKNGLSLLLPLKSPKGLVERMVVSDVGAGVSSAAAAAAMGGSWRFFNTGGITTESSSSSLLMKREPEKKKKKKRECQIKTSSGLQRERCDEISSTKVSLNQFPGLMVHGIVYDSKTRRLLRSNPDTGYFEEEQDVSAAAAASTHHGHYELQVPHRHFCRGSAYGWLFLTDDNLDVKLLNPFSGAEIQLPPVNTLPPAEEKSIWFDQCKWSVTKAVFSANPSIEPRPVVLIIYGGQYWPRLAFCKPGDKGWTPLEFPKISLHVDAIYHKDQFYVLGYAGYITAFDIGRRIDDDDHSVKTIRIATHLDKVGYHRNWHLVVLDGELVSVEIREACFHRSSETDGDTSGEDCTNEESHDDDDGKKECVDHRTYRIKIRRFDASEKQWVKVESLGDKAVFLGLNTSFALSASDYPAGLCIPDSVYFTGGGGKFHYLETSVYDMGIYNVKNNSVKPLYPPMDVVSKLKKPAPIWIVNPLSDDIV